jgi:hypothetical protein
LPEALAKIFSAIVMPMLILLFPFFLFEENIQKSVDQYLLASTLPNVKVTKRQGHRRTGGKRSSGLPIVENG